MTPGAMAEDVRIIVDQTRPPKQFLAARPNPQTSLTIQKENAERRATEAQLIYGRGKKVNTRQVRDKKLRSNLQRLETRYKDASLKAKDAEILLEAESGLLEPEGELERTYKVRQDDLRQEVNVETANKVFDLRLEGLGPYVVDYSRNGRGLLLAGRKGHVSTMDWRNGTLGCELQLQETVRDAKWLHNTQYFAVAQKRSLYIYDHAGVEIHCLDKHVEPTHLQFLPYHFLLASIGNAGYLKYTDTSTGKMVAEMPTKLGTPTSLSQNPSNAILNIGHQNGTVTLWSPNSTTPLVKLLAHRGPVRSTAIDREGRYMVSAGQDSRMSVWDMRTFKEVNNYFLRQPGSSVAISDRNLTAVSWGTQTSIWKGLFDKSLGDQQQPKIQSPYMAWGGQAQRPERLAWCPFEDILGIGHSQGFSSILVPGAGEPNFDALELNPYETVKQRQETEIKSLLNKLQPEMISLNPNLIGKLDVASEETRRLEKDLDRQPEDPIARLKDRGKGKNSGLRKFLRKKGRRNIIDEQRLRAEATRKEQSRKVIAGRMKKASEKELGPALGRFVRKSGA